MSTDETKNGSKNGSAVASVMRRLWGLVQRCFKNDYQYTWVYCPGCQTELIADGSYAGSIDELEVFKCRTCGNVSLWDFSPPAPLLIERNESA